MAVRVRRASSGTLNAGAATTIIYTVPADRTLRVYSLLIGVITGAAGSIIVNGRALGALPDVQLGSAVAPAAGVTYGFLFHSEGGVALNPGDTIRVFLPAGATGTWWLSGALLEGAPA